MSIEYTYPPQDARNAAATAAMNAPATPGASPLTLFGDNGPSFKDIVDAINPLQQIPLISSIYQSLTGDVPSTASSLAGGALFGGPLGFIGAAINAGYEAATGSSVGDQMLAMLDGTSAPAPTQYAASAYQKTQDLA